MRETGYFVLAGESERDESMSAIVARHSISRGQFDSEADARLIAAAPDMFAALKDYIEWGAMTGSDRDLFDRKFREAIAKAEGQ